MENYHAHTPQDFLRVLPRLLGFAPRRCVLLVAFRGGRTSGLLRFALPTPQLATPAVPDSAAELVDGLVSVAPFACTHEVLLSEIHGGASIAGSPPRGLPDRALRDRACTMMGHFCRIPDADQILPVIYTDRGIGRLRLAEALPWRAFMHELLSHAEIAGFGVRDALVVTPTHWGHYLAAPTESAVHRLARTPARPHETPRPTRTTRDAPTGAEGRGGLSAQA
ncbi:DUF4192 family protein [Mycetocola tolaasinivorans]|uniref:DUF4192 family protein n=1 Tax=Mycetocola tolaasinivorans TaxID=76635 RepID=A0A3L7A431_9MICO|nr:DUF4192 family protein [Mycetocola tolaasinivorans]RLP74815.1 DUF4192 family protein [Mycetocola tolaasinivorans]